MRIAALGLVLGIAVCPGTALGQADGAAELPADVERDEAAALPEPGGFGDLLELLPQSLDLAHFRKCDAAPSLVLNEVCSVGTECDEDVRISDFIEVYNPDSRPADLACFVLLSDEGIPFSPIGSLDSGEVKAWGEKTLGFRISKNADRVLLLRLGTTPAGDRSLRELDSLVVRETQSHSLRIPDAGDWSHVARDDAEAEPRGSYGRRNSSD